MQVTGISAAQTVFTVLAYGGFAVGYAILSIARKFWYMPLLVVAQFSFSLWGARIWGGPTHELTGRALQQQLLEMGVGAVFSLVAGYTLFSIFIAREGSRSFRAHAEIGLAAEIHRSLVPSLHQQFGNCEFYGTSVPSGQVGGDLVDFVKTPSGWIAYVADVAGHGVSAGVMMAMFKAAVRTRLQVDDSPAALLREVHNALFPLKPSHMFATAAILGSRGEGDLDFACAGHPPILHFHYQTRSITEYPALDMPLGIQPSQTFTESRIHWEVGDILMILTDGLVEVFGKGDEEYGLEAVKAAFKAMADEPLEKLFQHIRQKAVAFGRQSDDQTMLMVRWVR